MSRPPLLAALGCAALVVAGAAGPSRAQLGTSGNVPPQHLFDTDRPQRLDTGLGTRVEPPAAPAQVRRAKRPVHRTRP